MVREKSFGLKPHFREEFLKPTAMPVVIDSLPDVSSKNTLYVEVEESSADMLIEPERSEGE